MRGLPLQVKQQPLSDRSSCFRLENSIFVCVPASAFFLCVLFSPFSSVLPLCAVFAFVMWFSPSWFFVRAVLAFVVLPCCVLGPFCVRCLLSFLRLLFPSLWSFLCAALPFLVCCFPLWVLPVCSSLSFVVLPVLAFVGLPLCAFLVLPLCAVLAFWSFLGALSPFRFFLGALFSPLVLSCVCCFRLCGSSLVCCSRLCVPCLVCRCCLFGPSFARCFRCFGPVSAFVVFYGAVCSSFWSLFCVVSAFVGPRWPPAFAFVVPSWCAVLAFVVLLFVLSSPFWSFVFPSCGAFFRLCARDVGEAFFVENCDLGRRPFFANPLTCNRSGNVGNR